MNSSRARLPLALALTGVLLVGSPLLAGCGLIGNVVNGGGGGLPGGLGGGSIPSDFPSEVPLIDGDVAFAIGLGDTDDGKVWNVTINVSDGGAFDTITSQMQGAGFESQNVSSSAEGSSAAFTKGDLGAFVVVSQNDGAWTANYTVTRDQK